MTIVEDLKRDEGWEPSAYQDSLGYWTIGYGFLIDDRKGGELPKEVAEFWLEHLIRVKQTELDEHLPWWREQPEDVQRALLNMCYQLGIRGLLCFSRTLGTLRSGDRELAAQQASESLWARQTPARARRVCDLIRGV